LEAEVEAEDFLREPICRPPYELLLRTPERIGPYRILEKIGHGGMGAVYRAMRDDGTFRREVAIKLIIDGAISQEASRRFQDERQILASLDHPWIAQIHDGGTTDDDQAYLVMEYVQGEPIDQFSDREGLSAEGRIQLFRKVCAAVHFSHQNLIVHCDLKPSNILVTAAGVPKLLDFGIAKLLVRKSSDERGEPSTVGSRPLTPEYASPEQVRGDVLSTVSDVYSLGILLQQLLTGSRPELQQEASKASLPDLPRDLGAILSKALRPDPRDRFSSVERLSEDLRRYLEGFPVLARQGSSRYKAKKFLLRHRGAAAVAVITLAVLASFAFSMGTLAGHLSKERAKLQEVVGFFESFFERAGPLVGNGRDLTLREAVDQNASMMAEGLEGQPAVKAELAAILGAIYRELGQSDSGLRWSRQALALNGELFGEDSQAHALSLIQVGASLRELESYKEAEEKTLAGLRWFEKQPDADPLHLTQSLNSWVTLLCHLERYQEADGSSSRALLLAENYLDETALETLEATASRGLVLRHLGQAAEAERLYEKAIDLYRAHFGETHPHVAVLLLNLSALQRERGDLAKAERSLQEVNRQHTELFGDEHYKRVKPLMGLAALASRQEHIDEALAYYREAIRVGMATEGAPAYVLRPTLDLAGLVLKANRCSDGIEWLLKSLHHCQAQSESHWRYAEIEGIVGECLARQELRVEARAFLERSHQRFQGLPSVDPKALRRALERLVSFYRNTGDEAAREKAAEALRLLDVSTISRQEE